MLAQAICPHPESPPLSTHLLRIIWNPTSSLKTVMITLPPRDVLNFNPRHLTLAFSDFIMSSLFPHVPWLLKPPTNSLWSQPLLSLLPWSWHTHAHCHQNWENNSCTYSSVPEFSHCPDFTSKYPVSHHPSWYSSWVGFPWSIPSLTLYLVSCILF